MEWNSRLRRSKQSERIPFKSLTNSHTNPEYELAEFAIYIETYIVLY